MAIHFILEIVIHLLQCALYVAFGHDMPSFLEIILFEFVFEILKNFFTVKPHAIPRSNIEIPVSFDPLPMTNVNSGIPLVRSITIYRICQALDLEVILAPTNDINPILIPNKPKKGKPIQPTPIVYSITLFKMCEALDINTQLRPEKERPAFVNKKKKQVPVVHSPTVFCICKALQIDAKLANISDKDIEQKF
ncbi:hypothetical protein TNIN_62721 [Trichonephila inaurata madagascariensis]|uniref:Uncharacterized protein n=1 Tax=Trichonephila inaurata madagascariensis TaxID=2747483 RepID=A0A8X6X3M9_9ARAC|nr:hypothetical protein TNIN_62721 [Trichonephila inaurata madagascariensis]